MISSHRIIRLLMIFTPIFLVACSNGAPPAGNITVQSEKIILPGESVPLAAEVTAEGTIQFKWSATNGEVIPDDQVAVVYTAPDAPGTVTITLEISNEWGTTTKTITFEVLEPTPFPTPIPLAATETPLPSPTEAATEIPPETPTLTPIPDPIPCNHLSVAANIFSQAQALESFSFYGPVGDPNFLCQGVYDLSHTPSLSVKLQYSSTNSSAFFGLSTGGYDATAFTQICLWVYTQIPNQVFRLQMKDTNGVEKWENVLVEQANQWTQVCKPLLNYSALGVQINSLENINLGFNKDTNDITIWVDDFEFKP